MKNLKRNVNGITLIALVVTIIILLILAGVTLNIALSENGLFDRAKQTAEKSKDATEDEQVKVAITDALIAGAGTLSTDNVNKAIQSQFGADKSVTGNGPWTFEGERNTYTIEATGKIEKLGKSDISVSLTIKGTHVEEKDIPIPTGFVHVGGSINEGYVISDAKEDEGKNVDSDDLKGNQFVWVPVDKDQKITAKVESKEDITSIIVTDPYGDKIEEKNNVGKTYSNDSIEPTINGEYKIKVTTSKGETSKTLEVYSLYAKTSFATDALILERIKEEAQSQGKTIEELLKEMGMTLEEALAEVKSAFEFEYSIRNYKEFEEKKDYTEQVNENGGFYIGRYEAGDSSAKSSRTESSDNTGELVVQKNKYVYNYISYDDALNKAQEYATNVKTNVTSSLLTGAAWDRTLGWLYETGNKTIEEIVFDSTGWGNYIDDEFSGTNDLIQTGVFDDTRANNIYDLAGNVEEWTTESWNGKQTIRGCSFRWPGINPAFKRDALDVSGTSNEVGFRLALY